jgi:hypothetical protein
MGNETNSIHVHLQKFAMGNATNSIRALLQKFAMGIATNSFSIQQSENELNAFCGWMRIWLQSENE